MTGRALACYLVDVFLLFAGLVSAFSGFVLLGLGEGRYRGGREALPVAFGVSRQAWVQVHEISSIALVGGVVVHLLLHWSWLVRMTKAVLWGKPPKAPVCPPEEKKPT